LGESMVNESMVDNLIANGVDFSLRDNNGKNPLFYYIEGMSRHDDLAIVTELASFETCDVFKKLIDAGANPCDISSDGKHFLTPLIDSVISVAQSRDLYLRNETISSISNLVSNLIKITDGKIDISSIRSSDGKVSLYDALLLIGAIKDTKASEAPMSVRPEDAVLSEHFAYMPNVAYHMMSYFKKNFCCEPSECKDSEEKIERYVHGMEKAIDGMGLNDSIKAFKIIEDSKAIGQENIQMLYDKIFERYPDIHTYAIGSEGTLLISALRSESPNLVKQLIKRGADASMPVFLENHGFTTPVRYIIEENADLSTSEFSDNLINCIESIVNAGASINAIPMLSASGMSSQAGKDTSYLLDESDIAALYAMVKSTHENSSNDSSENSSAPAPRLRI